MLLFDKKTPIYMYIYIVYRNSNERIELVLMKWYGKPREMGENPINV